MSGIVYQTAPQREDKTFKTGVYLWFLGHLAYPAVPYSLVQIGPRFTYVPPALF